MHEILKIKCGNKHKTNVIEKKKSQISIFKYISIDYNLKKHHPLKERIFACTWLIELAYRTKAFVSSFYQKFGMPTVTSSPP